MNVYYCFMADISCTETSAKKSLYLESFAVIGQVNATQRNGFLGCVPKINYIHMYVCMWSYSCR
jgi:hypothetical protein